MRKNGFFYLVNGIVLVGLFGMVTQGQEEPVFKSDVKVVNVLATVRGADGRIVRGLTKEDFQLSEDGRSQQITYFSQESDLPLTIGLLIDVSGSQMGVLDEERNASYQFIEQLLRLDRDRAFVMQFDQEAELVQDLTSSLPKLSQAIGSLRVQQPALQGIFGRGGGWPLPWPGVPTRPGTSRWPRAPFPSTPQARGGTAVYDAIFLASDELMSKQPGRKALVILSDGVDNASLVGINRAIEYAQRADTVVYAILYSDAKGYARGGGRGRHGRDASVMAAEGGRVLTRIADETGARVFDASREGPLASIYATIGEELRNQYNLGYSPDEQNPNHSFRSLKVTTNRHDLKVQARSGYYPVS